MSRPLSTFSPATFAILIFFCLSCNKNTGDEEQEINRALRLNEKTIQIPLDEQTSDYSYGLAYYHSDKPLLFNFNPIKKAVQVYDLKTQQLFKELTFKKEGSEGIGRLTGFFIQNLDSIFIFTNTPNTIYLTDLAQSYLLPISLNVPDGYAGPEFRSAPFYSYPILRKNKMLAKVAVPARMTEIEESQLSQQFLSAAFSLENGESSFSTHQYPSGYMEEGLKAPYFSMAASPDRVVYSFFGDHRLLVAEANNETTKLVPAKSRYLPQGLPTLSRTADRLEYSNYLFTSPRYEGLIYDAYREVFYRFCYPSIAPKEQEEINQLRAYPEDFSIMILDSKLKVLGESRFSGKHLVPNNVFVAEEGLYISSNHPDNPNAKEDVLEFILLELLSVKI
ncbi:DUF4221 family protein [Cyclobacterium sp. 1_MG-2023]|uniref:DUF4221 family protein n=1 Tax=Cyclobacterium sp. 1_MG-2023 TaxID=3062681 RepID=UPI0026E148C1|nr:DUF4221 family protein [Cyclobacterium sp. 1_MG-2023]MDO6437888.1 DUF4221 family protein [Cyclobacterium sp. 1_MG-2023]